LRLNQLHTQLQQSKIQSRIFERDDLKTQRGFLIVDLIVVVASIVVLSIGSNGQVFATSAIRQVVLSRIVVVCYKASA